MTFGSIFFGTVRILPTQNDAASNLGRFTSPDPTSSTQPDDPSSPGGATPQPQPVPGGCTGGRLTPIDDDWSLPGPRRILTNNPEAITSPHHDYPAWDWMIGINTPIYAVRGGVIDTIYDWPHNWWEEGCNDTNDDCSTCGVGATIVDDDGHRWSYCHGTTLTDNVTKGERIEPGTQLMWSGNSGRSGAPHLHLEIRTSGTRRCPQPLINSLYTNEQGLNPSSLPTSGCSF